MALWVEIMPIVGELPKEFVSNLSYNGKEILTVRQWHFVNANDLHVPLTQYRELKLKNKIVKVAKIGEDMPSKLCPWIDEERLSELSDISRYMNQLSVFRVPEVCETKKIIKTLSSWCCENEGNVTMEFLFHFNFLIY